MELGGGADTVGFDVVLTDYVELVYCVLDLETFWEIWDVGMSYLTLGCDVEEFVERDEE